MLRWNSDGCRPAVLAGIVGCILLVASSCATRSDLRAFQEEMQAQSSRSEIRLANIETSLARIDSLIREQNRTVQNLRAVMGTQAQEQRDDIAIIMARQDDINYQLQELSETLQAIQLYGGVETNGELQSAQPPGIQQAPSGRQPQSPSVIAPSTPPQEQQAQQQQTAQSPPAQQPEEQVSAETEEPDDTVALELFESALTDLRDGNYLLAESLLLSFLMQYPAHDMAPDAQFWLGEAAYGQGNYDLAISEFRKVIDKYPDSDRIPGALLRIGEVQMEQGDTRSGAETLNRLITSYPDSDEAAQARAQLNRQ